MAIRIDRIMVICRDFRIWSASANQRFGGRSWRSLCSRVLSPPSRQRFASRDGIEPPTPAFSGLRSAAAWRPTGGRLRSRLSQAGCRKVIVCPRECVPRYWTHDPDTPELVLPQLHRRNDRIFTSIGVYRPTPSGYQPQPPDRTSGDHREASLCRLGLTALA